MTTTRPPIALVTGGSRGLGRNTALAVAARGVDVIFTYRTNKAEAEKVVAEIKASGRKALALQLDVAILLACGRACSELDRHRPAYFQPELYGCRLRSGGRPIRRSMPGDAARWLVVAG